MVFFLVKRVIYFKNIYFFIFSQYVFFWCVYSHFFSQKSLGHKTGICAWLPDELLIHAFSIHWEMQKPLDTVDTYWLYLHEQIWCVGTKSPEMQNFWNTGYTGRARPVHERQTGVFWAGQESQTTLDKLDTNVAYLASFSEGFLMPPPPPLTISRLWWGPFWVAGGYHLLRKTKNTNPCSWRHTFWNFWIPAFFWRVLTVQQLQARWSGLLHFQKLKQPLWPFWPPLAPQRSRDPINPQTAVDGLWRTCVDQFDCPGR